MKRLWTAAALLTLVFAATLYNSHYLKTFTEELTTLLTQAEELAEKGDWATADTLTGEALDKWHSHEMYLYTMLRHSDTDSVHVGFREVQEYINCQEGGEYSASNARLMTQLELLAEMEQFSLMNLL